MPEISNGQREAAPNLLVAFLALSVWLQLFFTCLLAVFFTAAL